MRQHWHSVGIGESHGQEPLLFEHHLGKGQTVYWDQSTLDQPREFPEVPLLLIDWLPSIWLCFICSFSFPSPFWFLTSSIEGIPLDQSLVSLPSNPRLIKRQVDPVFLDATYSHLFLQFLHRNGNLSVQKQISLLGLGCWLFLLTLL